MMRVLRSTLVSALAVLTVTACSGNEAEETTTSTAPQAVVVTAVDYAYEGLPERVAEGTMLSLSNESTAELHELVAIRLPDDETRSVEELVVSPEDLAALFPSVTTVLITPPGSSDGFAVEGNGRLNEPGRYAIICAIPTGADPDEYLTAAAQSEGGPPQVDGGPPHFAVGMYAEVVVEG